MLKGIPIKSIRGEPFVDAQDRPVEPRADGYPCPSTSSGRTGKFDHSFRRFLGWLLLAAAVIVLDQATKAWVVAAIPLHDGIRVTDFFNLVFVFNPGAAFSFLSAADGWQRWLFLALATAISLWLMWMIRQHAGERLQPAALALILGGAIGNAIDRIHHGAVVDFLDFHFAGWHFWAFNVADSAISVGVAMLLLHQFTHKAPKEIHV